MVLSTWIFFFSMQVISWHAFISLAISFSARGQLTWRLENKLAFGSASFHMMVVPPLLSTTEGAPWPGTWLGGGCSRAAHPVNCVGVVLGSLLPLKPGNFQRSLKHYRQVICKCFEVLLTLLWSTWKYFDVLKVGFKLNYIKLNFGLTLKYKLKVTCCNTRKQSEPN